jgi:hypothetical protein
MRYLPRPQCVAYPETLSWGKDLFFSGCISGQFEGDLHALSGNRYSGSGNSDPKFVGSVECSTANPNDHRPRHCRTGKEIPGREDWEAPSSPQTSSQEGCIAVAHRPQGDDPKSRMRLHPTSWRRFVLRSPKPTSCWWKTSGGQDRKLSQDGRCILRAGSLPVPLVRQQNC